MENQARQVLRSYNRGPAAEPEKRSHGSGNAAADGGGDDAQLGHELGEGFVHANAALAEYHVVFATGEDVLGAHQQFFHGGGHVALEKNGFTDFTKRAKEIVVLHVARADLKDVHVTHHHLNLRRVHYFADGEEAEFVGGFAQELEARFAHALERV